jgi:DMSO/TMAO reductase YedYZ heme-binding membrane subunit
MTPSKQPPPPAAARAPHTLNQGWPLLGCISLMLLLLAAAVLLMQPDVDGLRRVIRLTARSSFVLFVLAFSASALARRWPGAWTRWQLRNRRYLGLGFAVSHAIHLAAIVGFAQADSVAFHQASGLANVIAGGIAYVFIALMSATSSDGARRWLGAARWARLHTVGSHYLWVTFMISFGMRIPKGPGYALPVLVLLAVMALRLWPARRHARAA